MAAQLKAEGVSTTDAQCARKWSNLKQWHGKQKLLSKKKGYQLKDPKGIFHLMEEILSPLPSSSHQFVKEAGSAVKVTLAFLFIIGFLNL